MTEVPTGIDLDMLSPERVSVATLPPDPYILSDWFGSVNKKVKVFSTFLISQVESSLSAVDCFPYLCKVLEAKKHKFVNKLL